MKILVVEDEEKAGAYLKKGLIESGYNVDLSPNGVDGLYLATTFKYDLIILDIMLPTLNGWQVLKTLRTSNIMTPVIILSAKDQVDDRVKGLELGANDYLVKPFAFIELLARIKNCMRHQAIGIQQESRLYIADLTVDLISRKVTRGEDIIKLTAKEFMLLEYLLTKKGQVVTRTQIASAVWDMNFDSDTNIIDAVIKRLRSKIDRPYEHKLILTIRGMGYKLDDSNK
ncbi:heavy metal response regulator transcription factor (plasmid) [Vibrio sp. SS-MA-C1-2]|uniref:heavy metal response regulator transcription factor n=1 Tax=Vibrio sp. SS-MA-C1-2 TaxID=2908646 RepID=UPI001F23FDE4|nr:heavy metal response regulator transcription factor [Vibrio sp. SS-MA-C1-2]UJF20191.1 heavy metal response regulator transcription factor [Vibrio sp. SS-MA-C1-2]